MDVKEYKLLKDYGDFYEGDVITAEELPDDDVAVLVEEGVLEEIVPTPPTPEPVPTPVAVGKGKYKVLGPIAITDGQGQKQGEYRVGVVYEFTEDVGDLYVSQGLAEKVAN